MSMNALVLSLLHDIGAPVAFQEYTGSETTYATFYFPNEQPAHYADDEEIAVGYLLNIDVWTTGNYIAIVEAIEAAMKEAGWRRRFAVDLYEKDTKIYHKALGFRYTKPV